MNRRPLNATINLALAVCVATLLSTAHLLDGPDDIQTAQAVSDDLKAAINSVAATTHSTSATSQKSIQLAGEKP